MNVLLITLRADVGGGPKHVHQLLQNADQDINYYIAAPMDEPFGSKFMEHCGHTRFFELPHRRFGFKHLMKLRHFCLMNNIKVVHSHGKGAGIYSRLLKIILPSIRVVHTFHGVHVGGYSGLGRFLYSGLEFAFSFLTYAIIAVSESERDSIRALLYSCFTSKVQVIKNGVYVPGILPEKPSSKSGKLSIVVVSRFDYQKNTDLLIDILKRLSAYSSSIEYCYVLGDGQDRHKVLQLLEQPLGYRLECPGSVSEPQKYYLYSDIILNTSRWEGLSLGVLEAMAYGAIPVLTNVTGNCDILSHHDFSCDELSLFDLEQPQHAVNLINKLCVNRHIRHDLSFKIKELIKNVYDEHLMASDTFLLYK